MIRVVAAYIYKDEKILLARRRDGDTFGNHWESPGGKVEPGETDKAALQRELHEELGTTAWLHGEPIAEIQVNSDDPSGAVSESFVVVFYFALLRDTPRALASEEIRWFQASELKDLLLTPANKILFEWCSWQIDNLG